MRFRAFLVIVASLFCQALFAKGPVPLAKAPSGDRTNHPVLFVSGLGSNASGTWGAKGKRFYCENPELMTDVAPKVVSYEWGSELQSVSEHFVPHMFFRGLFVPKIAYPYRCSNTTDTVYGGAIVLKPLDIFFERVITKGILDHDQLAPLRAWSGHKGKGRGDKIAI